MKQLYLAVLLLTAGMLGARNLINDPECGNPASGEVMLSEGVKQGILIPFEENLTWNRCYRMELTQYKSDAAGKKTVSFGCRIGGSKKMPGFLCEPDTVYQFSVELKGRGTRAMMNYYEWDKNGKRKKGRTSIHQLKPQTDWTVYKGTFKTGPTARYAALGIQFWGNEAKRDLYEKIGDYLLIDKISIEPCKKRFHESKGAVPQKLNLVPVVIAQKEESESGTLRNFLDYSKNQLNPWSKSSVSFSRNDRELILNVRCEIPAGTRPVAGYSGTGGDAVWLDDLVEIFLSSDPVQKKYRQFVVSAGGGRWSGNGSPAVMQDYKAWQSKVVIDEKYWEAKVRIPFALLGITQAEKGTAIRFNIGRQRPVAGKFPKPDMSKANRWRNQRMIDISCTSRPYGMAADKYDTAGVIILDSLKAYAGIILKSAGNAVKLPALDWNNPAETFAKLQQFQEQVRLAILGKQKFLVNQIPLASNPALPFFPQEIGTEQKVFRLRAAVNEHASMALGVANMTQEAEEYRIVLNSGWAIQTPVQERPEIVPGLKTADGKKFPAANLTMRRGAAVKDSNAPEHGRRLDMLVKLDDAHLLPVGTKEAGLLWLEFDCTGVAPGLYKGMLQVIPLNGQSGTFKKHRNGYRITGDVKEFPVELEVLPFELPRKSPMPFSPVERITDEKQSRFFADYDCFMYMVTPWFFTFTYASDGSIKEYTLKKYQKPLFDQLQRHLKAYGQITGTPAIRLGHDMYPVWKKHLLPKTISFNTPEYWNAWRHFCVGVDRILRENGFCRTQYTFELFDEPDIGTFSPEELLKAHRECKKVLPAVSLQMASGISFIQKDDVFKELAQILDLWTLSYYRTQIPEFRKKFLYFRSLPGKHVQIYSCGTSMRQDLYRYYRMLPWNAMEIGADSVSIYRLFPYTPQRDLCFAAEGEMAYLLPDAIVPSLRLENFRTGLNDIKYLKVLEKLASGNSAADKADREFVKKAVREVFLIAPHDYGRADAVREQVIERILKRVKK